jgi:hypothetical protein
MKKHSPRSVPALVLGLAFAVGLLFSSKPARACGSGGGDMMAGLAILAVVVVPVAAADVVFTGYDAVKGLEGERASKGMAIAEIAVASPQLLLVAGAGLNSHSTGSDAFYVGYSAWMGALVMHGIVTLATMPSAPPSESPSAPQQRPADPAPDPYSSKLKITFTPTMVSDGSGFAPGLGAVGRF